MLLGTLVVPSITGNPYDGSMSPIGKYAISLILVVTLLGGTAWRSSTLGVLTPLVVVSLGCMAISKQGQGPFVDSILRKRTP